MRVRLQYGIDDSSLPDKIKELLQETESLSELQSQKVAAAKALLYSANNIHAVTQILEDARKSLVDIDTSLADVHAIAKGYSDYLMGSPSPQQATPPQSPRTNRPQEAPSSATQKPAQQPAQQSAQQTPPTVMTRPNATPSNTEDVIAQMGQILQEQDQA